MHSKDTDGIANSAHPDQTAPALFAQTYLSENLGSLRYFVVGLCQSICSDKASDQGLLCLRTGIIMKVE